MTFREKLRETDEFQQVAGATQGVSTEQTPRVQTPRQAVAPVVSLEKTDVQFWLQVVQVILLVLIWREMSRRGAA